MSDERGEIWSAFLLHEDGTWIRPCFWIPPYILADRDYVDEHAREALMDHYGHDYFTMYDFGSDEECTDEHAVTLPTWPAIEDIPALHRRLDKLGSVR